MLLVKVAMLLVLVTPSTQSEPLYIFNELSVVLKCKSPTASELPPPSDDGLLDDI